MTISRARVAVNIEGLPEMPISGLRIYNLVASANAGVKASHTAALELHDVQVNAGNGPAFLLRDSKEVELVNVATRKPLADAPVVRLDRCPGAIVRASRAFEGTGTFLSTAPGELKSVVIEGNVLSSARKPTAEKKANYWQTAEPPAETEPVKK
jgi:hypothetical protein